MHQHLLQGDGHQLPRFVAGATNFDTADRQARISQTILSPSLGMHSIGLGAEKYAVLAMQALKSPALASLECFARQFMKVLLVATSEVAAAAEAHLLHDGAHAREAFVVALPGVEQQLPNPI